MAMPSSARAELRVCQVVGFDMGRPTVECHSAEPCSSDAGCVAMDTFRDPQCTELEGSVRFCAPRCGTLFGCELDSDCPMLRGVSGRCDPTGLGDGLPLICRYGDGSDNMPVYCPGPGGIGPSIAACHRMSGGGFTSDWYEGNCDGDGCPNGSDPNPCTSDPTGSCAFRMETSPVCDPAMTRPDAGVPSEDAGTGEDAGVPGEDAGMTIPPPQDAGPTEPSDGGSSEPMDGGTVAPPGTSFAGGGGCRCVASGRSADGAGALALMSLLGLALLRRRRR